MALTFEVQPTGNMGALSPIIYQAYDSTNYSQTGFYYQFDVYVWSGTASFPASPNYTITRFPDTFGNNRGWIDIHKLVNQALDEDYFQVGTYQPNISNGAVYFGVKVKGVWDSGSTSFVSSNIKLGTNGWTYTIDGFNVSYSGKIILSDKTALYLTPETNSYYVWYDATQVTGITIGSTTITPNSVTNSNQVYQGVDIVQLLTAAGVSTDTNITFTYNGGSVVLPIYFNCENKYGSVTAHYLNRYGVYETMVFNALSRRNFNYTKETYQKPVYRTQNLANAWSYGVHIQQNFLTNANTQLVVNTDYIPESYNEVIQQIFASDNLLIEEGGDAWSARITDTSFNRLTRINDKLIQYTLNLEYNQPLINKIVR